MNPQVEHAQAIIGLVEAEDRLRWHINRRQEALRPDEDIVNAYNRVVEARNQLVAVRSQQVQECPR